jgi:hypothetical protein
MKVFIHDTKHDRVIGEHSIGYPGVEAYEKIKGLVTFLNENVTTRYNTLVVAKSYSTKYDEENGFSEIVFDF